MTANRAPTADELNGVKQDTVHWPAKTHRVTQVDSDGNEITDSNPMNVVITDPTNGNKAQVNSDGQFHIVAEGKVSTENSTATLLPADTGGSDHIYTGTAINTLPYAVIVVAVYSDVASAVDGLKVEQSCDGTNWDHDDVFSIPAGVGKTFSFQPTCEFLRVRYINGTSAQSSFRLSTTLKKTYVKPSSHRIQDSIIDDDDAELIKAVLTGEDPDGIFRNVDIERTGILKTGISDGQTGTRAEVETLGSLKTVVPIRLVGTAFSNGTKDTNFWTETVTGTGTVTQAGQITLSTGTTANSTSKYETVRKARKVTGTANQFRAIARNVTIPSANCIRRIGPYNSNDGFFMQYDGETFAVGSRKSGSDTIVENGNFNGNLGATIDVLDTNYTRIVIEYTSLGAKFFVNGILIHTLNATTASLTNTLILPATMEIINENGNTTNNSYNILFATIIRLGPIETEAKYRYIGTNTTTICKYGAGKLKRIVNLDNAGSIIIYDNTAASGTQIGVVDTAKALGDLTFEAPFDNGLTIVSAGGAKVTVIYE